MTLRDAAFSVSGGAVRKAEREQQGSNVAWEITVEPVSAGAVTIGLPETTDCDASGAICTADERALSHSLSATIAGPVGIAVADARVDEAAGALLTFAVTLSRAASGTVTVDFATADGSAQAGVDYTAARDTLTFQAGESPQTVNVTVLDDLHDEGEETLTLSNASGGRLTDDEATGTIVKHGPAAAGAAGAVRPGGGGARGRARRGLEVRVRGAVGVPERVGLPHRASASDEAGRCTIPHRSGRGAPRLPRLGVGIALAALGAPRLLDAVDGESRGRPTRS